MVALATGIAATLVAVTASPASADDYERLEETFAGSDTASGAWDSGAGGKSKPPCLTAGTGKTTGGIPACPGGAVDTEGSGTLRLTTNDKDQAGFVFYTKPRQSGRGARFEFDMYQYASTAKTGKPPRGGDGISFFMIDGEADPDKAGGYGAGLGYSTHKYKNVVTPGLVGGLVGVGFDEYGNFSSASFAKDGSGMKTAQPNNVVIRAGEKAGYTYVKGQKAEEPLGLDSVKERSGTKRHVTILISTANYMTVDVDYGKGPIREIEQDLDAVKGQPRLPETYKFGFAASTGSATAVHEISGFKVRTLMPNLQLSIRPKSEVEAGKAASIGLSVNSTKLSGPTTGPVTLKADLPEGFQPTSAQSARGTGWNCDIVGQEVTCTRPGTGDDTLQPGVTYPEVTVDGVVSEDAPAKLQVLGDVTTKDEFDPKDNKAQATLTVKPKPVPAPDLLTTVVPEGDFTSPGTGTYKINVSNGKNAGPTTDKVTTTFDVPEGQTVRTVAGEDWACATKGQKVTCTRPDRLGPGAAYPPIQVDVTIPAGVQGAAKATAVADTPGEANPADNTASTQVQIAPKGPDLSTRITPEGEFTSPGGGTYKVDVSNAKDAGPTTGPATETITVPDGQTIKDVAGAGWKCETAGQKVTCTRPDKLDPGQAYPPITVSVALPGGVAGPARPAAHIDTPGDIEPSNNDAPGVQVPIKANGPDLTTTITPKGDFTSPGTGTYTIDVSNAEDAGPSYGPATETITVPEGQTVKSAVGDGWTCKTSGQKVTCTRPDSLAPGAAYPPITVTVEMPPGVTGPVSPGARIDTDGDVKPENNEAPEIEVPIRTLGPDLTTKVSAEGEFTAPGGGTYRIDVSNAKGAGPNTGPVTETITVPDGQTIKDVTGDGWECTTEGQKVSCTRADRLDGGRAYPPIRVKVDIPAGTAGPSRPKAEVDTKGDTDPTDNVAPPVEIPIRAKGPDLTTTIATEGQFTAPGTGTYRLDVSNDPDAGPTTGTATETFVLPKGQTPTAVTGEGWKCATEGQQITCTRGDTLDPGAAYPPIKVTVKNTAGIDKSVAPTATIKTPGDANPKNDTATKITDIRDNGPDLSMTVRPEGDFTSPGGGTYRADVTNAKGAGPTTEPTTTTVTIPDGQKITDVTGDGWECTTEGQKVTCTRPDVLQPGRSYPPVRVKVEIPADQPGPAKPAGRTDTPGDTDESDNDAPPVQIPIKPNGPDLKPYVTAEGDFVAPGTGTYKVVVTNDPDNGPTTGPATLAFTLPKGQTPKTATGEGWECTAAGQKVTCTRADTLKPDTSFPPVTITVDNAADLSGTVRATATVGTPKDIEEYNNTRTVDVTVQAKGPDLSTKITPAGEFTSPGGGTYKIDVSNAPEAGPTSKPNTTTMTVPDGQTVTAVSGEGWTCETAGQKVTCTRPDKLGPGRAYPPITVQVENPAGLTGPVRPNGRTDTAGDTDPGNNAAPPVEVPVKIIGPDLTTNIRAATPFTSPGNGTYQVDVSNNPGAGPTYQKVTEVFNVPAGETVTQVTGEGWECRTIGQKVTCTRPGTGKDTLNGGQAYPPIMITVAIPAGVTDPAMPTAEVSTPGDVKPANNKCGPGKGVIIGPPVGPNLSITARQLGDFVAGETGTIQLEVANAVDTDPTSGPVTVTFPMPRGVEVDTVEGDGWTCSIADPNVTCTRSGADDDALQPGDSYPMISVSGQVCSDGQCRPQISAKVEVAGDVDLSDNVCGPARLTVLPAGTERRSTTARTLTTRR